MPLPSYVRMSNSAAPIAIRGAGGSTGAPGSAGADGVNAFSYTLLAGTVPAQSGSVDLKLANNTWVVVGQVLLLGTAAVFIGYYRVSSVNVDGQTVSLTNLQDGAGAYATNAAPGTAIPSGTNVTPAGEQGVTGATQDLTGYLTAANKLGDIAVADRADARTNLGCPGKPVPITEGGTGATSAVNARTALGLAISTDVHPWTDSLDKLAFTVSGETDIMAYWNGSAWEKIQLVGTWAPTFLAAADFANGMAQAGVTAANVLLGSAIIETALTTDQEITINIGSNGSYRINKITIAGKPGESPLVTAEGSIGTTAGGSADIVALNTAMQVSASEYKDLTLQAATGTGLYTNTKLYLKLSVTEGDGQFKVLVFGDIMAWDLTGWT